ncbi:hypothetical protein Tco_0206783, partial [Tanacetum coccineum]
MLSEASLVLGFPSISPIIVMAGVGPLSGKEMDLFSFIHHADPTKMRIDKRQIEEGQVPLLESTEGRVIPLAGGNEQGGQNDNAEV